MKDLIDELQGLAVQHRSAQQASAGAAAPATTSPGRPDLSNI